MAALPSAAGAIEAWSARLVTDAGRTCRGAVPPYGIPSIQIDAVRPGLPISLGYMRGGSEALTGFATESFVDEMARALNADPFSFPHGRCSAATCAWPRR